MGKGIRVLLAFSIVLFSCERYEGFGPVYLENGDTTAVNVQRSKLVIGCEGNFQLGNASLSALDLSSNKVQNNLYETSNDKSLGDVLQSMYHRGDTLFVVINNSGIIRLLNDSTFNEIGVVEGLDSPRHLLCEGSNMYVTDLYSNKLSVFNLETLKREREVEFNGWSEKIISHKSDILVANITENRVEVFDRQLIHLRSIELNFQPRFIEVLNEGVVIAGNDDPFAATSGAINLYDDNYNILRHHEFPREIQAFTATDKSILAIAGKKFLEFSSSDLSTIKEVSIELETPYSMIVNEEVQDLYVTDARDFISKGKLVRYSLDDLSILGEYEVGQIPQSMLFTLERG